MVMRFLVSKVGQLFPSKALVKKIWLQHKALVKIGSVRKALVKTIVSPRSGAGKVHPDHLEGVGNVSGAENGRAANGSRAQESDQGTRAPKESAQQYFSVHQAMQNSTPSDGSPSARLSTPGGNLPHSRTVQVDDGSILNEALTLLTPVVNSVSAAAGESKMNNDFVVQGLREVYGDGW